MTLAQGRVFARIGHGGTRLTDLAEMAEVTKQTAGFLVDRLADAGYVERVPDPSDARARLVRIADRGRVARGAQPGRSRRSRPSGGHTSEHATWTGCARSWGDCES